MKKFSKVLSFAFVFALLVIPFAVPHFAHAQYATTTAAADINDLISDVSAVFALIIGAILGFLAALIGLGMGVRYFKRWIGRK